MGIFLAALLFWNNIAHADINSRNAYEVFGLSPGAGEQEVKKRYRDLSKEFHPDRAPEGQEKLYTDQFQKLQNAYDCLMDPGCKGTGDLDQNWGRGGFTSSRSAKAKSEFSTQEQYPWKYFSEKVDEKFHHERGVAFTKIHDDYFAWGHSPPTHPGLKIPNAFKKYIFHRGSGDLFGRSAWLKVMESIPEFKTADEAKAYAHGFTATTMRRAEVKFLTDLSDAQMTKMFQLLYTAEPKLAWQVLEQKVSMNFAMNPKSNQYLLFALANADLKSAVDQNALSSIINSYSEIYRDYEHNPSSVMKNLADRWELNYVLERSNEGIRQYKNYRNPTYTLSKHWKTKLDQKVLKPLVEEMKTLAVRSPNAFENLKNYLSVNHECLESTWLEQLNQIPRVAPVAGSSVMEKLPAKQSGLANVDSLEDYFQTRPPKPKGAWNCVTNILSSIFKR